MKQAVKNRRIAIGKGILLILPIVLLEAAGLGCKSSIGIPANSISPTATHRLSATPPGNTATRMPPTSTFTLVPSDTVTPTATTMGVLGDWTTGGPWGGPIADLEIDPVNPENVYAATWYSTFFRSANGGESWSAAGAGIPPMTFLTTLAMDPISPSTLYLGTNQGVLKSTDGGGEWVDAGSGIPSNSPVDALAADPSTPDTLYAGVTFRGVYKSTDGGEHWKAVNTSLPDYSVGPFFIEDLAIDPTSPSTLFLATWNGLYKSADGGKNWISINAGLSEYTWVLALEVDPTNSANVYAATNRGGVIKSFDGGDTWIGINAGLPKEDEFLDLAVDPSTPSTLYAATAYSGVYRSEDGGESWEPAGNGVQHISVESLAIDPKHPSTVYAGTWGGVYKTTDRGGKWNRSSMGLGVCQILSFAIDPAAPANLHAGTRGMGLYKSMNGGKTWNPSATQIVNPAVISLVIDPKNTATLYAAFLSEYSDDMAYLGVYKSSDGGTNWIESNGEREYFLVNNLAIDPKTPKTLYAVTEGGEIYKSTNGAATWNSIDAGLPKGEDFFIGSIAVDPVMPATLYIGTYRHGVFKSADGGSHWKNIQEDLNFVEFFVFDPVTPTVLYAVTGWEVYKSTDSGATWTLLFHSDPSTGYIQSLVINPLGPTRMYAGSDSGVYRSTDGGATWDPFGLPSFNVTTLAIDPSSSILYAGTWNGVYSLQISS